MAPAGRLVRSQLFLVLLQPTTHLPEFPATGYPPRPPGPARVSRVAEYRSYFMGRSLGRVHSTVHSTGHSTAQYTPHMGGWEGGGGGYLHCDNVVARGALAFTITSPTLHTQCLVFNRCNKHHGRFTLDYLVAKGDCRLVLQLPSVSSTKPLIHNPHPRPEQDHSS